ncbi:S-adenosyl-L-methionine-dependent methyltransferase [Diaporthe sp. PMI_573]|nr:S-adenosyl-L-methionine-dependent methyltransferase [Diaporthaceae sp. PMI_573]
MFGVTHSIPKKAMPFDAKLFDIVGADETVAIARHEMTLLPPFPPDAVIHDAACGLGAVTESILTTTPPPPPTIKIHATDVAPPMAAIYNQSAEAKGWPCRAEIMDAQKLAFPDATFTHTFLSFGLPIIGDPVAAASEMYRTLKPGGTAVTAFWLHAAQGECAMKVCRAIRGPDARLAIEPHPQHSDKTYIKSLLVKGGFRADDCQLYEHSAYLHVSDLRELATAIWSAIGRPKSGWTKEDDEKWDEAIAKYEELLPKEPGYQVDGDGNVTLTGTAQIVIVRKEG